MAVHTRETWHYWLLPINLTGIPGAKSISKAVQVVGPDNTFDTDPPGYPLFSVDLVYFGQFQVSGVRVNNNENVAGVVEFHVAALYVDELLTQYYGQLTAAVGTESPYNPGADTETISFSYSAAATADAWTFSVGDFIVFNDSAAVPNYGQGVGINPEGSRRYECCQIIGPGAFGDAIVGSTMKLQRHYPGEADHFATFGSFLNAHASGKRFFKLDVRHHVFKVQPGAFNLSGTYTVVITRQGTVSITNNWDGETEPIPTTSSIVGSGTAWTSALEGKLIYIDAASGGVSSGIFATVLTVTDTTHMTISGPISQDTASSVGYEVYEVVEVTDGASIPPQYTCIQPNSMLVSILCGLSNRLGYSIFPYYNLSDSTRMGLRTLSGGEIRFTVPGVLTVSADADTPYRMNFDAVPRVFYAEVTNEAPAGSDLTVDIKLSEDDGATWTVLDTLTILDGEFTSYSGETQTPPARNAPYGMDFPFPRLKEGWLLGIDITQVGSTTPGDTLVVTVVV